MTAACCIYKTNPLTWRHEKGRKVDRSNRLTVVKRHKKKAILGSSEGNAMNATRSYLSLKLPKCTKKCGSPCLRFKCYRWHVRRMEAQLQKGLKSQKHNFIDCLRVKKRKPFYKRKKSKRGNIFGYKWFCWFINGCFSGCRRFCSEFWRRSDQQVASNNTRSSSVRRIWPVWLKKEHHTVKSWFQGSRYEVMPPFKEQISKSQFKESNDTTHVFVK